MQRRCSDKELSPKVPSRLLFAADAPMICKGLGLVSEFLRCAMCIWVILTFCTCESNASTLFGLVEGKFQITHYAGL